MAAPASAADRYRNPLPATIPATGDRVETFADPDVIQGRDGAYYAYGTTDPLNDRDRDAAGALRTHHIPTLRSTDLVHWTYVGDAFTRRARRGSSPARRSGRRTSATSVAATSCSTRGRTRPTR